MTTEEKIDKLIENKKNKLELQEEIITPVSDSEINYQENVSAIEQDLTEVEQTDKLQQAYNQLYSDKNLQKITELNRGEISKIGILQTYAKHFGFSELEKLIDNFLRNRVSLKRKGRTEHVTIASTEILREEYKMRAMAKHDDNKITNRG